MDFFIVDAFTDTPFQGNPAGIFFEDDAALSDEQRMRLCAEMSLESAFILPASGEADLRMRYYTAVMEIPFCGHATVAGMTALAASGRISPDRTYRVETNAGILPVTVTGQGDKVAITLNQRPGQLLKELSAAEAEEVTAALRLTRPAQYPLRVVSTGSPWLLYQALEPAIVDSIDPRICSDAIIEISKRHDVLGVYIFAMRTDGAARGENGHIWSRCFCPIADLPEDPVTGSALGCVGCYLGAYGDITLSSSGGVFRATQGFAGRRWGSAYVAIIKNENDEWQAFVTGSAIVTAKGEIFP